MIVNRNDAIGRVIRFVDKYTILINAGIDCVKLGDSIEIYEEGEDIYDLDGNFLGRYDTIKDKLEVIRVEENFSVCMKEKIKMVPSTLSVSLANLATSPLLKSETPKHIPINFDYKEITPIKEGSMNVKIGDPVRLSLTK